MTNGLIKYHIPPNGVHPLAVQKVARGKQAAASIWTAQTQISQTPLSGLLKDWCCLTPNKGQKSRLRGCYNCHQDLRVHHLFILCTIKSSTLCASNVRNFPAN